MKAFINDIDKKYYYEKGFWSDKKLIDFWNEAVKEEKTSTYIITNHHKSFSYKEIDKKSDKIAAFLQNLGVSSSDKVVVQLPCAYQFVLVFIACLKLDCVFVPISMSGESKEISYYLDLTKAKTFIYAKEFKNHSYDKRVKPILSNFTSVNFIELDLNDDSLVVFNSQNESEKSVKIDEIKDTYKITKTQKNADDIAILLSTSGTTGKSKLAMLTHNNIIYAEKTFNTELNLSKSSRMFMCSPLNHATGLMHGLISVFIAKSSVVLQDIFDVTEAIYLMNFYKCTYSMGATTFIYDILRSLETTSGTIKSLEFYLCGGASVPSAMIKRAYERQIILMEVYGSTESTPHVFVPKDDALRLDGKVSGRAIKGVKIKVVDDNGNEVEDGCEGEECSKGPQVFVGYYNQDNSKTFDEDGFFHSGDLCVKDKDGFISITGRKKDIIVRGGENLSISMLEENLHLCNKFSDFAICAMKDSRMGERICAFVVLKNKDKNYTLLDLLTLFYEKNIPKYQWPERLEIVDKIPKTDSGKVKRFLLTKLINDKLENEQLRS